MRIKPFLLLLPLLPLLLTAQERVDTFISNYDWSSELSETRSLPTSRETNTNLIDESRYDKLTDWGLKGLRLGRVELQLQFITDAKGEKAKMLLFHYTDSKLSDNSKQINRLIKEVNKLLGPYHYSSSNGNHPKAREDTYKWFTNDLLYEVNIRPIDPTPFSLRVAKLKYELPNSSAYRWGSSREEVAKAELITDLDESMSNNLLSHSVIDSINYHLLYRFTNNKLHSIIYILSEEFVDDQEYIQTYSQLITKLTERYGKPTNNTAAQNGDPIYKIRNQEKGVANGPISFFANWESCYETTELSTALIGSSNKLGIMVVYTSYQFIQTEEGAQTPRYIRAVKLQKTESSQPSNRLDNDFFHWDPENI